MVDALQEYTELSRKVSRLEFDVWAKTILDAHAAFRAALAGEGSMAERQARAFRASNEVYRKAVEHE